MVVAPLLLLAAAQIHDPAVLRCAFEDRSRMVLFNPAPGLWMAYNPTTCTLQKVWEGDVEWKGKVFDFSQDNSRAKGETLYEVPSFLARIPERRPGTWKLKDVAWDDGWKFANGGTMESPGFDTVGFTRLCVMFDETSRKGSVRAEIVGRNGQVQSWFESTKHGHSDTDWQFNMKLLPNVEGTAKLRITQPGDFGKKLRNVRVFADWQGWTTQETVRWKGYRYDAEKKVLTCLSEFTWANDRVVHLEQDFGADEGKWWTEVRSDYQMTPSGYPPFTFRMAILMPKPGRTDGNFPVTDYPYQNIPIYAGTPYRKEFSR